MRALGALRLALLAALLGACGARSELRTSGGTGAGGGSTAPVCQPAGAPHVASVDRIAHADPPATYGTVVVDPVAQKAILIGGLKSSGVYAKRISVLDLATLEHHVLQTSGDAVSLPANATGVWDAGNGRAIVIGGTAGGADLDQVFSVRVDGEIATVHALPSYPAGGVYTAAAAYDPEGQRIIATGSILGGDPAMDAAYRTTYALDLRLSSDTWSTLLPASAAPTAPPIGEERRMVYDPAARRMILTGTGTNTTPGDVFALDLQSLDGWKAVSGALPDHLATIPLVVRDERSCGFLGITGDMIHCTLGLWSLRFGTSVEASSLGAAMPMPGGPGYGPLVLDEARDRLLIIGGGDCAFDNFLHSTEIINLAR